MSLKLVSLNIERSNHLDVIVPFLQKETPDVVCLQEVMAYDVPRLEEAVGATCHFTPVTLHAAEGKPGLFGQAIFSKVVLRKFDRAYYWGSESHLPTFDLSSAASKHATENHVVTYIDAEHGGELFRIATTHFTWTPDGKPDDLQRSDLKSMFSVLDTLGQFVLCGDFNAPRGGEIFSAIAAKYKDNIPTEYKTSIDANMHRAGKDKSQELADKMVDGLFTTNRYKSSDVRLVSGLSDHMAIVANIDRSE